MTIPISGGPASMTLVNSISSQCQHAAPVPAVVTKTKLPYAFNTLLHHSDIDSRHSGCGTPREASVPVTISD